MRRALERIAARLGFVPRARLPAACPCGEGVPAHAVVALTDGMSEIFVLRADLAEAARWFNEAILRWQAAEAELAAVRQRADDFALAGGRSVQLLLAQREAAHKEAAAEQRRGDRLALLLANLRRAAEAYLRSREDAALGVLRQALAADAPPMERARRMFLVSDDDKRWTCAEEFTGREEAVAWGRAKWPARRIFTGKTAPVDLACLHGARVLAELVQHVEAQVGDKGRPGWPALPAPDAARLGAVLNASRKKCSFTVEKLPCAPFHNGPNPLERLGFLGGKAPRAGPPFSGNGTLQHGQHRDVLGPLRRPAPRP